MRSLFALGKAFYRLDLLALMLILTLHVNGSGLCILPVSDTTAVMTDESADNWLKTLAAPKAFPHTALTFCLDHFEIVAPELRAILEKAADGEELSLSDNRLFFWGLHLMAAKRDTLAFQPLLRILAKSGDDVEELFGDTITETLPRVIVSLFDGDDASLFNLLADKHLDGFVRWSLFSALAFLTFDGKISLDLTEAFLIRFDTEDLADEDDMSWLGWQEAISLLALRSLAERVERRSHNGVMAAFHGDGAKGFYEDLEAAEAAAPDDITRFANAHIGYFEDICGSLDWVQIESGEDDPQNSIADYSEPKPETYINPWRNVGRNDPCPCGSGKKAKKCCLASA